MPDYRRNFQPGGTFFFTVVTCQRFPIFDASPARDLLGEAFRNVKEKYPFTLDAICLLPDHLHCLWTLPESDGNYSIRWSYIKAYFTHRYKGIFGAPGKLNESRENRREGVVWQRRFWEHTIRDEQDFAMHFDYIHYNPVKHGLVQNIDEWEWSSFHHYVNLGWYPGKWEYPGDKKVLVISDLWD